MYLELGCHLVKDIWEFKENQIIVYSIRENQRTKKDFLKSEGKSEEEERFF